MRTTGLVWGVALVMVYGVTAQAAPKNAAGAAGAAATAPGRASATPAPSAAPDASASAPAPAPAPDAPLAPDASAPTPDTATPPPPPPTPDADGDARPDDEEEEREPPRKKRKHRRHARLDDEDEERADDRLADEEPPAAPVESWGLKGTHFLLGVERITNVLGWSITQTSTVSSGLGGSTTLELKRGGTDVSFLGSGASGNYFGLPRVAFDGMFGNGFTLGGSLSYMVVSREHERADGTTKSSVDDGSASVFILAPRIGVIIPASPFVGVWLRGGISRISISQESPSLEGSTATSTITFVDLTLDPQLVITPVPHVGITVGALLDIGVSGTVEMSGSTTTQDVTMSSYGITSGLVAIF